MQRDTIPTFVLHMALDRGTTTPSVWRAGGKYSHGRPTKANLAKYIKAFEESTQPGGVNEKLGVLKVTGAQIIRQATDEVVATY